MMTKPGHRDALPEQHVHSHSRNRARVLALAVALALLSSSCSVLALFKGKQRDPAAEHARLQAAVMEIADQTILDVGRSARQYSRDVNTPDAHYQSVSWTVNTTNRVLSISSNPSPINALVDLTLYVSVQRIFHEKYLMPQVIGEPDRRMVESFTRLETRCWNALAQVLDQPQIDSLHGLLNDWENENQDLSQAVQLDAPSFADLAPSKKRKDVPVVSDLYNLLNYDPLSSLEPAVQEVATTRQLGERVLFFGQHMPRLLTQEVELMTLRTARLPEVQTATKSAERVSAAAEKLAQAASTLPEDVRAERQKTIEQLSGELSAQREGLIADLERAREPLKQLLEQSRATLDSGAEMSRSINATIGSLDSFLTSRSSARGDSPGEAQAPHPFDVREFGDAAARIAEASHELASAIQAADDHLPRIQRALGDAEARAEEAIDHAYGRALRLLAWLVGLAAVAIVAVRIVWPRITARSRTVGATRLDRRPDPTA
jgi:hypothetical protein